MDKLKKTVAQLEETVDVLNRCIEEVKYEARLNNIEPEQLMRPDGTSKMTELITSKARVLEKLLEVYVWIEKEEKEETEEIHLPPQSIMERRYDLTKNRPRPWQHTAKFYLPKAPIKIGGPDKQYGTAWDFRLDLSGHISAYVVWHAKSYDQHIVNGDLEWIVTYGDIKVENMREWPLNLLEGRLIALDLVPRVGFPREG